MSKELEARIREEFGTNLNETDIRQAKIIAGVKLGARLPVLIGTTYTINKVSDMLFGDTSKNNPIDIFEADAAEMEDKNITDTDIEATITDTDIEATITEANGIQNYSKIAERAALRLGKFGVAVAITHGAGKEIDQTVDALFWYAGEVKNDLREMKQKRKAVLEAQKIATEATLNSEEETDEHIVRKSNKNQRK